MTAATAKDEAKSTAIRDEFGAASVDAWTAEHAATVTQPQ